MEDIEFINFEVIKQYVDYKHFAMHYGKKEFKCIAHGIAWISQSHANYYLSSVMLNSAVCHARELDSVGVFFQNLSMKFSCQNLDDKVKEEIRKHEQSRRRK